MEAWTAALHGHCVLLSWALVSQHTHIGLPALLSSPPTANPTYRRRCPGRDTPKKPAGAAVHMSRRTRILVSARYGHSTSRIRWNRGTHAPQLEHALPFSRAARRTGRTICITRVVTPAASTSESCARRFSGLTRSGLRLLVPRPSAYSRVRSVSQQVARSKQVQRHGGRICLSIGGSKRVRRRAVRSRKAGSHAGWGRAHV